MIFQSGARPAERERESRQVVIIPGRRALDQKYRAF